MHKTRSLRRLATRHLATAPPYLFWVESLPPRPFSPAAKRPPPTSRRSVAGDPELWRASRGDERYSVHPVRRPGQDLLHRPDSSTRSCAIPRPARSPSITSSSTRPAARSSAWKASSPASSPATRPTVAILTDNRGDTAPTDALRSEDGSNVTFLFDIVASRIAPTDTSFTFLVKTNATQFDAKGTTKITAFLASSTDEGSQLLAGGDASVATFRPMGTPGVIAPAPRRQRSSPFPPRCRLRCGSARRRWWRRS